MTKIKALLIALLLLPVSAQAFEIWECEGVAYKWNVDEVHFTASRFAFPADTDWRTGMTHSKNLWNQNPGNFDFTLEYGVGVGRGNGKNEIWKTDNQDVLDGAPALAAMQGECIDWWIFGREAKLTEVDVIIDRDRDWAPLNDDKTQLKRYGGSRRPLTNVILHELGHAVGLMHADDLYNIMGQDSTHMHVNDMKARAYIGEDAANGTTWLYGENPGNVEDVSVTHWKFEKAGDDGYSDHERTRILSLDDVPHGSSGGGDFEPTFFVVRGTSVKLELTYENSGKSRQQNLKTGFYLSSNPRITTSDRRLGGTTLDLGRNVPVTKKHRIDIPSDIAAGIYYVGAIVDEDDSIDEIVEGNNATYIRIRVNDP